MLEKKNEKEKIKLRGQLKLYIQWPSVMAVLLVAMNVWVYMIDKRAGSLMVFFVLIYIIMAGSLYLRSKTVLLKDLVEFAAQYGIVQNTLLKELWKGLMIQDFCFTCRRRRSILSLYICRM